MQLVVVRWLGGAKKGTSKQKAGPIRAADLGWQSNLGSAWQGGWALRGATRRPALTDVDRQSSLGRSRTAGAARVKPRAQLLSGGGPHQTAGGSRQQLGDGIDRQGAEGGQDYPAILGTAGEHIDEHGREQRIGRAQRENDAREAGHQTCQDECQSLAAADAAPNFGLVLLGVAGQDGLSR